MPRNSGTYTPTTNSWNPAQDGINATSSDWNALLADLAAAVTDSVAADGQTTTTALIPFAEGISVPAGAVGAPLLTFIGDATSGICQLATGQLTLVGGGTNVLTVAANKIGFFGAAPGARPAIAGAKGGNAALGSLISALAALGLITDGTTA